MSDDYYISEEEDTKNIKNHSKLYNNSNINNQSYEEDFQNNDLDNIKDIDIEINELELTNSNRKVPELNQINQDQKEHLSQYGSENPPNNILIKTDPELNKVNQEISVTQNNHQASITLVDIAKEPKKQLDKHNENQFILTSEVSQNEEITFKTKHPNNNHFIDISISNVNLGRNNVNQITGSLSIRNESIKQSFETQKKRNKSSHLKSEEMKEHSFIIKKLADTEKEYFELKYLMEQFFVSNEIKQNYFKKEGNSKKMLENLNEEHQTLTRNYDKFSQIYRVLLNVKFPEIKHIKNKNVPKNYEKVLSKYKADYEDLSNRLNIVSKTNFLEKLEENLAEISQEINTLENENRISRHSKKKSELKFDKTHKVLPVIDGKKIYHEYNSLFEQNSLLLDKINRNKTLIKEKDLNIVKFKEDLEKLKVIFDFYDTDVVKSSEVIKNYENFLEKMKVLEANKEELIRKNEIMLLKNKDLIDNLKDKKETILDNLNKKCLIYNEGIENLTALLEANYIRDTPKKILINKNKIDIVVQDKQKKLDTIQEKEIDNNIPFTETEQDINKKEKDTNEIGIIITPIEGLEVRTSENIIDNKDEVEVKTNEENNLLQKMNDFNKTLQRKESDNKEISNGVNDIEDKNEDGTKQVVVVEKSLNSRNLLKENYDKKMSKTEEDLKENGFIENPVEYDQEHSVKNLNCSVINKIGERDLKFLDENEKKTSCNFDFNALDQHDGFKEKFDQDSLLITLKELEKKSSDKESYHKHSLSNEGIDKQNNKQPINDSKSMNECNKEKNAGKSIFYKENAETIKQEKEIQMKMSFVEDSAGLHIEDKLIVNKGGKTDNNYKEIEQIPVFLKDLKTDTFMKKGMNDDMKKSEDIFRTEANRSPMIFSDLFCNDDIKPQNNEYTKKSKKEFYDLFKDEPQTTNSVSNNNILNFNTKSYRNEKVKTEKKKIKDELDDLII